MDDATKALIEQVAENAAEKAVAQTLRTIGIDPDHPLEAQRDMMHLRTWRITMEKVQSRGVLATLGFVMLGITVLIYIGIKAKFFGGI